MKTFNEYLKENQEELEEISLLNESEMVSEDNWLSRQFRKIANFIDELGSPFKSWSRALFKLIYAKKLTAKNLIKAIKKFSRGNNKALVEFKRIHIDGDPTTALYVGGKFCMACLDDEWMVGRKGKEKLDKQYRSDMERDFDKWQREKRKRQKRREEKPNRKKDKNNSEDLVDI